MKAICINHNEAVNLIDRACSHLGQQFESPQLVSIEPYKKPRTLPQNARFHAMVRALSQHTGHSERELKDWFKAEYGPTKRIQVGNQGKVIPLSTTQYNRKQMSELTEHVDRVCAENGVYLEDE